MYAEKNEVMQEAAETLYLLTEDAMVREQCIRRQEQLKALLLEFRQLKDHFCAVYL